MEKKYKIAGIALLLILVLVIMKKKKAAKKTTTKKVTKKTTLPVNTNVDNSVNDSVTKTVTETVTQTVAETNVENLPDMDVLSTNNIQAGGFTPEDVFIGFDYTGYDPAGKHCQIIGAMIVPFYKTYYENGIHRYALEGEKFDVIGAKTAKRWEVKDSSGATGYLENYCLKLID